MLSPHTSIMTMGMTEGPPGTLALIIVQNIHVVIALPLLYNTCPWQVNMKSMEIDAHPF